MWLDWAVAMKLMLSRLILLYLKNFFYISYFILITAIDVMGVAAGIHKQAVDDAATAAAIAVLRDASVTAVAAEIEKQAADELIPAQRPKRSVREHPFNLKGGGVCKGTSI